MSFLNKVTYGNLDLRRKEISLKKDDLSQKLISLGIYDRLFDMSPPENSSPETKRELLKLVKYIGELTEVTLEFCKKAEEDPIQMFVEYLERHGISDISLKDLNKVLEQTEPLLIRLKEHYNRPRPYQLASYYNLDLYVPIDVPQASSPAYPSGHAYEGYIIAELLAKKYPKHAVELLKLGKLIGLSRLLIGIHYRTDYDFGIYVAKQIIANNLVQL